jgi:hypothetical protein
VRAIAHIQPAFDVYTVGDEPIDLGEQRVRIEHHAVPDRAAHAGVQNTTRDLVQHERLFAEVDGMTSICAPLVADDPVGTLSEYVDELALPFVSPLRPNDDDRTIRLTEHGWRDVSAKKYAPTAFARGVD